MGNFDARAYMKSKYSKRKDEEEKKSSSKANTKRDFDAVSYMKSKYEASEFGFDTLETDLKNTAKTISTAYNGWQTRETMENTLSSVQSMYDRLGKYQEYQKKYGGTDLSDMHNSYKAVIDGWKDLTEVYGQYQNADAFNTAKKKTQMSKQFAGLSYDDVEAKKKEYKFGSDEYKFLDTYTQYTDLNEFDKALKGAKGRFVDYDFYSELEKARNAYALDNTFDLYKDVMQNEDFAEKSKYSEESAGIKYNRKKTDVLDIKDKDYAYINNPSVTVGNLFDSWDSDARSWIKDQHAAFASDTKATLSMEKKGYDKLTPEEVSVYNYWHNYDKENGTKKAQEFLDAMEVTLTKRGYDEDTKRWEKAVDDGAISATLMSLASVPTSISGGFTGLVGNATNLLTGKGYNPYAEHNVLSNFTSDTRKYTSENISEATEGFELFGQNIPSFLYNTGMSRLDSAIGGQFLGGAHVASMGANAYQNRAKELTEKGEDAFTVQVNALASGAAEALFEYAGFESLMKMRNADDFSTLLWNITKQGGVEALEEIGTEATNIAVDAITRGNDSEVVEKYDSLISKGFNKKDALLKTGLDIIGQVAWAGTGGFLGGFGAGGGYGFSNYKDLSNNGKAIKTNERTGDMLGLVDGLTPEESEAYAVYTRYANKGITADNISNAQLGNLHDLATADAMKVMNSKTATEEQKKSAENTLRDLAAYAQKDTASTMTAEDFDEDSLKEMIDEALTLSEDSEGYKLATQYNEKLAKGKKLSTKEIRKLVAATSAVYDLEAQSDVEAQLKELGETGDVAKIADAIMKEQSGKILTTEESNIIKNSKYGEYVADGLTSEEIVEAEEALGNSARVMSAEEAQLFNSLYDNSVDIEDYRASFNLVAQYAQDDFSQDTMLKNKGVLTNEQVASIYSATVIAKRQAQEKKIALAHEKLSKGMSYQGFIDDSIIDYDNKGTEGKVNWNTLKPRQREAITFIKGIAKATGMNLKLVTDGRKKGFNGAFKVQSNTIVLDIYAGIDKAGKLADTLVPTFSHELTHWLKDKSPLLYRKLDEFIFKSLAEKDSMSEEDRIGNEITKLEKALGKEVTAEDARDEIVARACEDLLSMSEEGKKLFNSLSESEQKTLVDKVKDIIAKLKDWITDLLSTYSSRSYEATLLREYESALNEMSKMWDEMLADAVKNNQALELSGEYVHNTDGEITTIGTRDLTDLSAAEDLDGKTLFQYRAMVEDEEIYREMLLKHKDTIGINVKQINDLFNMIDKAVDIISDNLEVLDYAWEADINDRAFSPVKPNSDSLYKVSLDFSTLCRKRLLQQAIQSTLQETLNKPLSKEEAIAIRDELLKVQEEGRQIEVACALCYVESARMKSPAQITKFLNNREDKIREFFANRSGGSIKEKVNAAEMMARENLKKANPDGLPGKNGAILDALTAPKNAMLKADADYIRAEGKKAKASYKLTENEQAELDYALSLGVDAFTSAKGLENLAKHHRDLFDAYTSFVRNATHSKGIENDTWWRAGDSASIGDNLIAQMNAENGLRSQSWSDFQVIHLLDYIAATIELSTKGAKRQSYTKVPDYVKLLGNTGDMINMSVIPEREFSGKLAYDAVEGMPYQTAKKLREQYHATSGIICIGVEDTQIRMLLADDTIDMVIPYHHSGMSKETRKLMHIPKWISYEKSQNDTKLSDADAQAQAKEFGVKLNKDANYQKSPKFSEWFNIDEARQIAKMENDNPSDTKAQQKYGIMYGAYKAMQNAADNYRKLCAERGLAPKFSQFTTEDNYWKLLTDRKMVDNVTGEIIEQQAIKPIFNEKHILEILNDELARYPQVKADQEYATRKVVEKFLSGNMKVDDSTLEAIRNTVDNVTEVNILESMEDTKFSMREAVEETRDLIAVHNISAEQLLDVVSRNQFIMPSIAVTNKGHTAFGDISVVFRKNTINPVIDRNNKLYGADAWTPTQTELKKNPKFDENATEKVLGDIKNSIGKLSSQLFDVDSTEFKNTISKADGSIYNAYAHNIGMQTAYALENGLIDNVQTDAKGRVDTEHLKERLDSRLDNDSEWRAYKKWLSGISNSIITDYDTASNEDILKTMMSQPDSAKAFKLTENGKLTAPAAEYNSIEDFHKNKGRLSETAEQEADALGQEFLNWAKDISKNSSVGINRIVKAINTAFNGRYKISDIVKSFADNGIDVSMKNAQTLQALYKQAVELPTPYFEAKPQRSVGINEIAKVVLPKNTSAELKARLADNNINFVEYESGNDTARIEALNSLEDVKFSLKDSSGRTLTKGQQEYFKDSKVRDENGNLLVVYHGTPNKNVNVFSYDYVGTVGGSLYGYGFYFSDNKKEASLYAQGIGEVKEYYINISNPIYAMSTDLINRLDELFERLPMYAKNALEEEFGSLDSAKDYYKEYIGKHKNGIFMSTFASESTLYPEVFNRILGNMGYDGIIYKEDGYSNEYVVFRSNQSKQTSNTNPTSSDDIRYSLRNDDLPSAHELIGEAERLQKENEKLRQDFEALQERLKIEKQVTNGNYFNENQLGAAAGHLRNISKSSYPKLELMKRMKDVYSYIAKTGKYADSEGPVWDVVFDKCYDIAADMLNDAKPEVEVDNYIKAGLKDIRKMRISLSLPQIEEAKYRFGNNYHRMFFGNVILAKDGIPLDAVWGELSSQYPGWFNEDTVEADQVGALYDAIEGMKSASEMVVEYNADEQARWLATEIYNQYWNVSTIKTTADKYEKKIKQLNFDHRNRIQILREDYNARLKQQERELHWLAAKDKHKLKTDMDKKLKEQLESTKAKYQKIAERIRENRDMKIAEAKEHGKERLAQYRENAEKKTRIQRITQNALTLAEWLGDNSKDKHIHESFKGPVKALLDAIDFSSKRLLDKGIPTKKDISLSQALNKVQNMMAKASVGKEELIELYGHNLDEDIEVMIDSVDNIMRTVGDNEFVLQKMTLTDLQTLDKMVRTIKHSVSKMNKFHVVNHAKGIANLSQESMLYLDSLGKAKVYDGLRGSTQKLLNWNNALPYYAFKRYGSGGMKIYEALQDGWDKFAFNTKAVIDYAEKTYTSEEVKKWSETVKPFKIAIPASEADKNNPDYKPRHQTVQMTIPQIMSLYCLQKREQAKGHILGGGLRVADFKDAKGAIVSQSDGVVLTMSDIATIIASLSDRQIAVADELQKFMNTTCTDWGNEVSMLRFGYKAFGEANYFPIQSDKNNLAVDDETEKQNSLFRLLNMSFTKSTIDKANNRVVISDIFDVFAQHTSDMAKYNALALPVLDAFKWYNYTEKQDVVDSAFITKGVKQSIESAFGKDGQSYFTTFLKDINGQQEVSRDNLGKHFFTNAKIAAVGANLRVIALQPTSYVRASAVIDNKYLMKALGHKPKIDRAEQWCGMALWKSMGYYDTNIQRGVEAQIKHNETWKEKAAEWSMRGASAADKLTWGYLWNACELEVRETRKDLKVGSKEFNEAIGKRLREIIYATQVVDSTMTRSQLMRSNGTYEKMLTAFASELTLSYNMLQDAYMTLHLDARQIGKKEAWKKNSKRIARVLTAYTLTNAVAALVETGFDAWRDDEDEEKDLAYFMKLYLTNFLNDMSVTGKIPYIKELHSIIRGFGSSRSDTQWMESIGYAIKGMYKVAIGEGSASKTVKHTLKAASDLFGLPFYNLFREIMSGLDNFELFTAEDLDEMFEDFLN